MNAEDLTFRRVLKPPGGEDNDIFCVRSSSQVDGFSSPRRVKNYQQSSIFSGEEEIVSTPSSGSGASTPTRRRLSTNSQERLFGTEDYSTPRRVVDRMKSTIFSQDQIDAQPVAPSPVNSKKFISRNPITGDVYQVGNRATNGSVSGSDGYSSNGSISPVEGSRANGIF